MFFTAKNHSALILKITSIWLELLTVFCLVTPAQGDASYQKWVQGQQVILLLSAAGLMEPSDVTGPCAWRPLVYAQPPPIRGEWPG